MIVVVFDTETTGLPYHDDAKPETQPRIIEVGALLYDTRREEVVDTLELLINPQQKLEAVITKITGLTDEDLADKPTFAEVEPRLREFFARAECVVAHNLPFDKMMMSLALGRMGLDINNWAWPRLEICTVQEHAEAWGRRPKLLELFERYVGRPLDQKHRALDDVRALLEVFLHAEIVA
jgi:DNA polymerase III epsilon subunit-like protein